MKIEDIERLIDLVAKSGVDQLEIETSGVKLRVSKHPRESAVVQVPAAPGGPSAAHPALAPAPDGAKPAEGAPDDPGLHHVLASMVGTFYMSPSPGSEPFVKVGDVVHKGRVLCILEAMKIMNEIESDVSGTVAAVLAEDAQPVEYGQRLFSIRVA